MDAAFLKALQQHLQGAKFICRKVPYRTKAKARAALNEHGYRTGCRNWYLCPTCDGEVYHLTSKRKRDWK
jgi:hypothetical protein